MPDQKTFNVVESLYLEITAISDNEHFGRPDSGVTRGEVEDWLEENRPRPINTSVAHIVDLGKEPDGDLDAAVMDMKTGKCSLFASEVFGHFEWRESCKLEDAAMLMQATLALSSSGDLCVVLVRIQNGVTTHYTEGLDYRNYI